MSTLFRLPAFISLFLVSVFGKLAAQSVASNKPLQIAVINSSYFDDEKTGVTKLLNTRKKVDAEFKQRIDEFTAQQKKLDDLTQKMQSGAVKSDAAKIDEAEKLKRDIKYKQENLQAQYKKRYDEVMRPVYSSMEIAMQQWSRQKGYDVLFDIAKDEMGVILWMEESKINAITDDLIKHFNTVL